jgi:hypothetical protein
MPQIFSRNEVFALKVGALAVIGTLAMAIMVWRLVVAEGAPLNEPINQPVPFSHKHHVADVGLDCRYCHTSVEKSAFAGMPPSETCMTCHSQLFTDQPMLKPVVEGFAEDRPVRWNRVNDLPDFAYFNHSIHVHKGVGCVTCHGRIDQMPLTRRVAPLTMQWCLACHRDPAPHLRPRAKVFDMEWTPPDDQDALGRQLISRYRIATHRLTNCSVCHR